VDPVARQRVRRGASRSSLRCSLGLGGRQIGRANANALAAKGNAGEDYCAGGVIRIGGNPHPGNAGRGLVAQPVGEGGDLGGGVEALQQFGGGLGWRRTRGAAD
jgi:hypothetical protein